MPSLKTALEPPPASSLAPAVPPPSPLPRHLALDPRRRLELLGLLAPLAPVPASLLEQVPWRPVANALALFNALRVASLTPLLRVCLLLEACLVLSRLPMLSTPKLIFSLIKTSFLHTMNS